MRSKHDPTFVRHIDAVGYQTHRPMDEDDALEQAEAEIRRLKKLLETKSSACPFCGSAGLILQHSTPDREGIPAAIMCDDCGAVGPWVYISQKTLEAYTNQNTLPLEPLNRWKQRS